MVGGMFSAGIEVVTAALTLAYIGRLLFGEICVASGAAHFNVAKRSLEGQHIFKRAR
jgi:hypothetical protein